MSRRSVQLVICLVAVMLVSAVTETCASPARVEGLNLIEGRAAFTRDYVNTYQYPVAIARYSNLAWGHLGAHSTSGFHAYDRVMGLFQEMGEDGHYGVLGITLRQESLQDPVLGQVYLDGASYQQFDIIWGRDFEQASVGFRLDMARSSEEDEDSGDVNSPYASNIGVHENGYVNTWGIGGAVDYDLSEDAMLELGGEVRRYDFRDDENDVEDDGSVSFRIGGRVFYERAANKTLIPLATFTKTSVGAQGGAEIDDTVDDFLTGVACNHVVNGDDLLLYGAAFRYWSRERTEDATIVYDYNSLSAPILFVALEHRFRSWLVGRGGASHAMVSRDYGEEHSVVSVANRNYLFADFDFALGIGLEFRNFTIDATLNENYPFTGFWFVSGQETPDPLFGQVSFTYTY